MSDSPTLTYSVNSQSVQALTAVLNEWAARGQMALAEQWLLSVINGQPNWQLADQCLSASADGPELSLLTGLLIARRRNGLSAGDQLVLTDMDRRINDWLGRQESGTWAGFSPGYLMTRHYTLLCSQSEDPAHLTDGLRAWLPYSGRTEVKLTVETGETGWILLLLNWLGKQTAEERLYGTVSNAQAQIDAYVAYLQTHQIPVANHGEFYSLFPVLVSGAEWRGASGQTWDQGDLSQLLVLYTTDQALGQQRLRPWADRLGGYLAQQRQAGNLTVSSLGLTDGMAGLGLLYRRLFILTRQQVYLQEAHFWLDETIRLSSNPSGQPDSSLRTGLLGTLCALRHWQGEDVGLDLLFL
jgi:hypothetical protein